MDWYPEEFTHGSPLLQQLSLLQQAMASSQDMELLDLVSSDSLSVGCIIAACNLQILLFSLVLQSLVGSRNP